MTKGSRFGINIVVAIAVIPLPSSSPASSQSQYHHHHHHRLVNFVAASRPDSPTRPRLRQDDWRQGIASDKELMDRATGKLVRTGGSAVSSSGQLPTSAEIEEDRGL